MGSACVNTVFILPRPSPGRGCAPGRRRGTLEGQSENSLAREGLGWGRVGAVSTSFSLAWPDSAFSRQRVRGERGWGLGAPGSAGNSHSWSGAFWKPVPPASPARRPALGVAGLPSPGSCGGRAYEGRGAEGKGLSAGLWMQHRSPLEGDA